MKKNPPLPLSPYQERLIRLAYTGPCFAPYQARDLWDLLGSPSPDKLEESRHVSVKRRTGEAKAQLQPLLDNGLIKYVEVKYVAPPKIKEPIYSSTSHKAAIDDAEIAQRLSERPLDVKTNSGNIYFSAHPRWWDGKQGETPVWYFASDCQYTDLKTLVYYAEIYNFLLRAEAKVVETFRFSPYPLPSQPDIRKVLNPFGLDRLSPNAPEMRCTVEINRGRGPVRLLAFTRPIPQEAVRGIRRQFDEIGQDFEIY